MFRTWPKDVQQAVVTSRYLSKDLHWKDQEDVEKTRDAMMDVLFLARSDFLLHSESGISEAAIYWNLGLHDRSILMYKNTSRIGFKTPVEFRDSLSSLQFGKEGWNPEKWRYPWNPTSRECDFR